MMSLQLAMFTRHPKIDLIIRSSQDFCLRTSQMQLIFTKTIPPTWSCPSYPPSAEGWDPSRVLQIVSSVSLKPPAMTPRLRCGLRQPRWPPGGWSSSQHSLGSDPRPDFSAPGWLHSARDSPPPTSLLPSCKIISIFRKIWPNHAKNQPCIVQPQSHLISLLGHVLQVLSQQFDFRF